MDREEKLEYWFCKIGPIDKNKIQHGGDYPLRSVVQNRFIEIFGKQAEICSSGWGLTQEMKTRLDIISFLPITDTSGNILKQIDKILKSAHK